MFHVFRRDLNANPRTQGTSIHQVDVINAVCSGIHLVLASGTSSSYPVIGRQTVLCGVVVIIIPRDRESSDSDRKCSRNVTLRRWRESGTELGDT